MNTKPAIIRLPPVPPERKAAYMRAAGRVGMKLTDWIFQQCDKAAEKSEEQGGGKVRGTGK